MFGHDSIPSKRYKYGVKTPTVNLDKVIQQLFKANCCGNDFVALEQQKRKEYQKYRLELYPELDSLNNKIEELKLLIEEKRNLIKKENLDSRKKIKNVILEQEIKQIKFDMKKMIDQQKVLKNAAKNDQKLIDKSKELDENLKTKHKELYKKYTKDFYWSTFNAVKADKDKKTSSLPKFHKFDGTGSLTVQIQKGMTFEQLLNCSNNLVQLTGIELDSFKKIKKVDYDQKKYSYIHKNVLNSNKRGILKFRIGSDAKQKPIWVEMPILFHREIPQDCRIKSVSLHRCKVGTKFKWNVQFIISKENWENSRNASSNQAVFDVGWRMTDDGLRIATWAGSDGNFGNITIPKNIISRWEKVKDLQSIRDKEYNKILLKFKLWIKDKNLPELLKLKLETLAYWQDKSSNKMASAILCWRANRFEGDSEMYNEMESWRKQDKHLYDWQEFQRQKNCRWRDYFYRNEILTLRKKYAELGFENVDWAKLQKNKNPEEDNFVSKKNRAIASVGRFVEIIKETGRCQKLKANNSSKKCNNCKTICELDGKEQFHTCLTCWEKWDRDVNAAQNLLEEWNERACLV